MSDGGRVSGAGSTTLTISNVLGDDGGSYTVVVSNAAASVTSAPPAVLRVLDPVITHQPLSQECIAGASVAFSVEAYGTTPAYQWLRNGVLLSGTTQPSLNLTNVTGSNAGSYTVIVSNLHGTVVSSNAALAVFYVPTAGDDQL